jgi:tRNA A-37 threonylcarbamoyl transferase component Bud32
MQILGQRGWLYALLGGAAFLLHKRRRLWLDALDRRFFREHYNVQRVLRAVVEEIHESRNFKNVAPQAVSQIERALHPEFVAILMRQSGDSNYRALASSSEAPPPIPAESKLIGIARLLGKPLEISQSQSGWLRELPRQEVRFLRQARIEWLFPIGMVEGGTEALLAPGPKRSEEPYSWEDQELLKAITGSLALLLEDWPTGERKGFEECPECGTCYDAGSGKCRKEGANLTPLSFPRVLAGRYRFERRLGEGGMGMVYESLDMELERRVAVKLIRPDLTASAEAVSRFRREARAAASFTNPNVVTIHDFGMAEGGRAYLVMELLHGSTLRQELKMNGPLPASRASGILDGVCSAVAAAHNQRLLHRDIKPENIFLVKSEGADVAKILDFGVVKPIIPAETTQSSPQTDSGMLVGTLKYMSPEQLRGEKPAESWDLWALAVVAYEMLASAHPFNGSTSLDVSNTILAVRITPLCTYLPEAPPSWQCFFDQALSINISSRPASALQFLYKFKEATR